MFDVYYLIFSFFYILKLDQHGYLPASGWEFTGKSKGSCLCLSPLLFATARSSPEMLLHACEPGSADTARPALGKILGCEWCFGGLSVSLTWLWSECFAEGGQRYTVCQLAYRNEHYLGQSLLFLCKLLYVYFFFWDHIHFEFSLNIHNQLLTEIITFIQQRCK